MRITKQRRIDELEAFLRWLSTYEKHPPEIAKDEFAYDRLLNWLRHEAWRASVGWDDKAPHGHGPCFYDDEASS